MIKKTIGRNPSNDYQLKDLSVSSQHAILFVSERNEFIIKDLNSVNGTFVNGKRITTETPLKLGDKVVLGQVLLNWVEVIQLVQQNSSSHHLKQIVFPEGVLEKKLIGRNRNADIQLLNTEVSEKHAYLCRDAQNNIYIVDNNSTNGTYVNGQKISTQLLKKGDYLTIAKSTFVNWENVYHPKKHNKKPMFYGAVAIVIALLVGAILFLRENKLEPTNIYSMYKKSVVLIYQNYTYEITCDGRKISSYFEDLEFADKLDCCYLDSEGELTPGVGGGTGTGFFISRDGKIITNRHVIAADEEKEIEIIRKNMQGLLMEIAAHSNDKRFVQNIYYVANNLDIQYKLLYLGIGKNDSYVRSLSDLIDCSVFKISNDANIDIAIIQTNSKLTPNDVEQIVDVNKGVDEKNLTLGNPIYTLGFPLSFIIGNTDVGLEANNQSGEITQERGEYIYGHNISIHQGASGSPVFDQYGRFAGVIVSGFIGISQGYNHAIKPKQILKIINQ